MSHRGGGGKCRVRALARCGQGQGQAEAVYSQAMREDSVSPAVLWPRIPQNTAPHSCPTRGSLLTPEQCPAGPPPWSPALTPASVLSFHVTSSQSA